ncbi:hypothetical protein IU451_28695 [Nocardia cyriacigeorgica]|uniref:hypothetical protein n=1 Tax=Nocardia cyriacigeorgica TaxID=135487 RepID=UPI00189577D8|nr:hypothetical protein [Nocardia cyriacigeorgica]MBF6326481.1 hypothetical protein [Nocardia cyriacigeorgica]
MSDDPKLCSKCGDKPAGLGGILCPDCYTLIREHAADPYGPWFHEAREQARN